MAKIEEETIPKCGCGLPFTSRAPEPFLIPVRWPEPDIMSEGGFWYWCRACDERPLR